MGRFELTIKSMDLLRLPVIAFGLILILHPQDLQLVNCDHKPIGTNGSEPVFSLVETINKLSLSFLPEKILSTENVIFSPLSIIMGLGMLVEGSTGPIQEQLISFLTNQQFKDDNKLDRSQLLKQLRRQFKNLIDKPRSLNDPMVTQEDGEWINEIVNLVMVTSDYRIKDDYKSTLESSFDGLVVNRDFKSSKSNLVDEVNQLVANKTNNMIKKALDGPIDPNTKLLILNALSFEGNWVHPFPKSLIIRRPFFGVDIVSSSSSSSTTTMKPTFLSSTILKANLSSTSSLSLIGSSVKNVTSDRVPFMTTSLRTNFAEINEKDMKIIQLDYFGNASMFILLPNQRDSLRHLVRNLTVQEIDSYIGGRLTQSDIDIEIPKFTFEVQYDLMERLEDLRLSIRRADYTGIAERFQEGGTKVDNNDGNESIGSGGHGVVSASDADAEGGDNESSKNKKNKKSKNDSKDNKSKSDIVDSLKRRGGGGASGGESRSSNDNIRISKGSNSSRSRSSNSSNKKELSRAQVRDQGHLSLSSAIHKSIIKVDEKGTKAAAFTGFGFHPLSTVSGQAQFIADHPFLFFIRDKSKGVNIFTGAVNKLTG
ncbi:uncharacterized protein LOC128389708 [Panonychus citri]|uniref:uncharacterized protein LOC128389708 n=1 Tax=Panonychus citri TaxID=50023 RepID=UPI00230822D8|nr:uncharacterized protein LOC128389708 [Panonychus citri]